ncbi:MFS transporter [Pelagicoccus sp. SDUM812003]|uniref:MFS transporter n=1 Tax=Pelagicoccus sp. SDUM812003 TaxID=3041267 RepID=UPI00280EE017|nr:MFS transporter [Pelagicoccus sp. SDUM812003]MDQ8202260.1 MFS transporter [Pelagicoccus sp. SDUM812003]
MWESFKQRPNISSDETESGLKQLMVDGVCGQLMILLTGGAFLVALAIQLGASNLVIGFLAAVGPLSQIMQIPGIFIVERLKNRKIVTVVFAAIGRLFLIAAALCAWLLPETLALKAFLLFFCVYFALSGISGCGFNSWIRDFIPENRFGSFMGKRMALATGFVAAATILAAFGMDAARERIDDPVLPYAALFSVSALIGLFGVRALNKIPEPVPQPAEKVSLFAMLIKPLRDRNFRRLLAFTASWNFTIVMAGAFFAVYMLNRIGIGLSTVILLSVLSQITNVLFFRIWGNTADKFSNKSVLQVASPLFLLMILLYPLTTMPERYSLSVPILVLIHLIGGIATAGFTLCVANIALKLAPRKEATAYLATNAFFSGIAATIGPIVGGLVGHYFDQKELSIRLFWQSDLAQGLEPLEIPALILRGLDFVFIAAILAGFYSLHRLSLVEEVGSVEEKQVREEVISSMRQTFVTLSNVAGLRRMTYFPYDMLRKTAAKAKKTARKLNRPYSSISPR